MGEEAGGGVGVVSWRGGDLTTFEKLSNLSGAGWLGL